MVLKLTAFKVSQPIDEFYLAVINSCTLMNLAQADIRRITSREVEECSGIQRGLSRRRSAEIEKYIETVDAIFPNSIILDLSSEKLINIRPIHFSEYGIGLPDPL
jgi:DGQHR domain-containing protein